jgi:hypothetical protein
MEVLLDQGLTNGREVEHSAPERSWHGRGDSLNHCREPAQACNDSDGRGAGEEITLGVGGNVQQAGTSSSLGTRMPSGFHIVCATQLAA